MLSILFIGVLVWFFWPAKPNLAGFNPNELGQLEAAMWRDYYRQSWISLASHIWQGARQQYGFSRWDSLRLAWHTARATRDFRQDTMAESAVVELTGYYRIVAQGAAREFSAKEAARLEVQWWRQRRAGAPSAEWSQTLAALTASIYGCSMEQALPAAQARVAAMVYRDARRQTGLDDDEWREVSRQLVTAYSLLKHAIEEKPRLTTSGACVLHRCRPTRDSNLILVSSPTASPSQSGLSDASHRLQPRPCGQRTTLVRQPFRFARHPC